MATVNVEFTGNAAQLTSTLSQIKAQSQSAFAEMTKQAASFTIAIAGVTAAVRKFASAWSAAASFEDATVRLAPMVGDLDTARELAEDLRLEAARGTQSFEALTATAQRLASVFKNTSDIKKWTTAFHDLSAGTGVEMERILQNFVRGQASGSFDSSFLDTLAKRGVNIYAELSKQLKVSETDIKNLSKTGQISFEQMEAALLSLTTGTGKFAGAAQRMSNTANGSFNSMVASFDIVLAKFATPINEKITPTLQKIATSLQNSGEAATSAGEALVHLGRIALPIVGVLAYTRAVAGVRAGFTALINQVQVWDARASAAFARASRGLDGFNNKLKGTTAALGTMKSAFAAVAMAAVAIGTEVATTKMEETGKRAETLEKMYKELAASQEEFFAAKNADDLENAWKRVSAAIRDLELRGANINEALGREEPLDLEKMWNSFFKEYNTRTDEFNNQKIEEMIADRLREQVRQKEEIAKKNAEIAAGNEKARKEVESELTLLRAELSSTEDLAAARAEITRQEQIARSIKAGATKEEAEAIADELGNLRKEVELRRQAASAEEALSEVEAEKAVLQAKIDKNETLVKQLETQQRIREETLRLENAGVDAAIAEAAAREKVALQEKAANAERQKYSGTVNSKEVNRMIAGGYSADTAFAAAQTMADWRERMRKSAAKNPVGEAAALATTEGGALPEGAAATTTAATSTSSSLSAIGRSQLDVLNKICGFVEDIAGNSSPAYAVLA